jgi:hypothetical protein
MEKRYTFSRFITRLFVGLLLLSYSCKKDNSTNQQTVTTADVTNVTAYTAEGGGNVVSSDGTYILAKGLCWALHENPITNEDHFLELGSGVGVFSGIMDGLDANTTYYVRAYAVTSSSTVYGPQRSFTTLDGISTLTTAEISDITGNSAICGGNITDSDGLDVIARGVCWSTNPNPTIRDSHTTDGIGSGSFTSSITNLEVNTTYFVRAYATTDVGTGYGNPVSFTTLAGTPTLTTADITNIGSSWAFCGGSITDCGGLDVIARGVCWSTSPHPTINDNNTSNGSDIGNYSSYITGLHVSTTYYVRAYASTTAGTGYGEEKSFTTFDSPNQIWVDLGLPSGTLWATCNVGADSPECYGDYFAWGETETKDEYNWSTYLHCKGTNRTLTKYCNDRNYGYNHFTDYLITLLPEDDAARINWGTEWRMPTKAEWQEMYQHTTVKWTDLNGVKGRLYTAPNGNSIFLPYAGNYWNDVLVAVGVHGFYWSCSLDTDSPSNAWYFTFSLSGGQGLMQGMINYDRIGGNSIRPVRSAKQ